MSNTELKRKGHWTHGLYAENKELHNLWSTMKSRCENPNREKYKSYGGRGITVCEAWHDFKQFYEWAISTGYKKGLQLDRINNDGNYEPENCRWVTPKVNSRNRRNTKFLKIFFFHFLHLSF